MSDIPIYKTIRVLDQSLIKKPDGIRTACDCGQNNFRVIEDTTQDYFMFHNAEIDPETGVLNVGEVDDSESGDVGDVQDVHYECRECGHSYSADDFADINW